MATGREPLAKGKRRASIPFLDDTGSSASRGQVYHCGDEPQERRVGDAHITFTILEVSSTSSKDKEELSRPPMRVGFHFLVLGSLPPFDDGDEPCGNRHDTRCDNIQLITRSFILV